MGDFGTIRSGERLVGQMSYENQAQEGGAILEGRSVCEVQTPRERLDRRPHGHGHVTNGNTPGFGRESRECHIRL